MSLTIATLNGPMGRIVTIFGAVMMATAMLFSTMLTARILDGDTGRARAFRRPMRMVGATPDARMQQHGSHRRE